MKRTSNLLAMAAAVGVLAMPLTALAQGSTTTSAPAANPAATTSAKSSMAKPASAKKVHMARIDLNTASKEDLMKLSGVTDEVAEKIIAARPFKSASELESKKILTKAEYGKVRSHVTVKHEKMAAAKK